jgi:hypothetical protein
VTPDFEWHPAIARALDGIGVYRGREGVEQFTADTSENWEELQNVAAEFRELGDRVLVLGRLKGRGKGSGAPIAPRSLVTRQAGCIPAGPPEDRLRRPATSRRACPCTRE